MATQVQAQGDALLYRTRPGDTLIGIGEQLLRRPADWPKVQRLNRVDDPYRMPVGMSLRIPLRLLRLDPAPANVVAVTGEARGDGEPLAPGAAVPEGSEVTTGDDGYLTIELSDGSKLTLQPRSKLRFDSLRRYRNSAVYGMLMDLKEGRVETEAAKLANEASRHEIRHPGGVVGVRGTRYRAAAADARSGSVEVTAGAVSASPLDQRLKVTVSAGFGLIARADRPLTPPTKLLAPPDLSAVPALQERVTIRLPIAPPPKAAAMRAQLATDEQFRSVLVDKVTNSTDVIKLAGPPDGDYWLRARAIDAQGLEGLDAVKQIRLRARPEPPFLTAPADSAKLRSDAPEFGWSTAEGVAAYAFQIARDDGFERLVAEERSLAQTQYVSSAKLAPGEYYWRVASVRADGYRGPFSDIQRLQLRSPPAQPEPPVIDDESIAFRWPSEPGQTFELEVARDREFGDMLVARSLDQPEFKFDRPASGTYYMRVRATDPDGSVGPYTATQSVVIPTRPWWLLLLALPLL